MGGKSSSKSSSTTTYENTDKRIVADGFGVGLSGDGNAVNYSVQMLDGGAVKQSADVVKAALRTVEKADAVQGEGFNKLLELAGDVLAGGATALERSQELTAQAYRESVETRQATIDNKTITVIAIAGAVAAVAYGASRQ